MSTKGSSKRINFMARVLTLTRRVITKVSSRTERSQAREGLPGSRMEDTTKVNMKETRRMGRGSCLTRVARFCRKEFGRKMFLKGNIEIML